MGSKMSRMVLLYTLILCMVSLPTSLPKHFLVETADNQGGDDYSYSEAAEGALELLYRPSPFGVLGEDSKEQQNKGQDYGRLTVPDWPSPSPSPSPGSFGGICVKC